MNSLKSLIGNEKEIALSFSAGTDSLCLLFCLQELGIKPTLYIYYVKDFPSEDLKLARRVAKDFNLNLIECPIPNDLNSLKADVTKMINMGFSGQVNIQCLHGHLYVAPRVKEKIIVNGSGIDALYGVYFYMYSKGGRKDKLIFDELRKKHLADPNDDAMIDQQTIFNQYGIKVVYPFRTPEIIDYLMGLSFEQINKPRHKWLLVKQFPEITERKYYRRRGSQQLKAGTKQLHQSLLKSDWNKKKRKRTLELYKDIEEELRC